jgi:hypothetical protein
MHMVQGELNSWPGNAWPQRIIFFEQFLGPRLDANGIQSRAIKEVQRIHSPAGYEAEPIKDFVQAA